MTLPLFIAADIGGTHARMGLMRATSEAHAPVEVLHLQRYVCADWPSLEAILADFIARFGDGVTHAVLACAGYVQAGILVNVNLPWPVSTAVVCQRTGLQGLTFINDFEALAFAIPTLDPAVLRTVVTPAGHDRARGLAAGPVLVMGPGTGLGCAAILPGTRVDPRPRVLPSEAAHTLLAPSNPREMAVLQELAREHDPVEVEHALSGPGLLNLYRTIARLNGVPSRLDTPAHVTRAALSADSPEAVEALEMFCALLGSFAADLTIVFGASGGVVLAGGILPQIESFLLHSSFERCFMRQGVLRPFLQHVPVSLIDHGELGVVGAACWSLQSNGRTRQPEAQHLLGDVLPLGNGREAH